jgi:hypothetical protein
MGRRLVRRGEEAKTGVRLRARLEDMGEMAARLLPTYCLFVPLSALLRTWNRKKALAAGVADS